jgi:hypothetical protein
MKKANLSVVVSTITTIVVCIAVIFGILAIIIVPLKLNPAYRIGMDLIKNDPAVIEFFGSPVKPGFFIAGWIKGYRYGGDKANLETSISGPKAHGTVGILGTETENGEWRVDDMSIHVDGKLVLSYRGSEPDKGFQPVR